MGSDAGRDGHTDGLLFELDETHADTARRRMDAIDAQPTLFEKKPEQLSLGGEVTA